MKITLDELYGLAGVVKFAQEKPLEKRRKEPEYSAAYPSYSRSLVSQLHEDPASAGRRRGLATGALGAILGALATRIATDRPELVAAGGLGGGLLGAIPGYQSGKQEAQSENSRRLFLRRLGISRPGELEALIRKYPEAEKLVLQEGASI
jgi:hypothetical protein